MALRRATYRRTCASWELYLFLVPALVYIIVFHYIPMLGVQIAFKDYRALGGIWGSAWVGFKHFKRFFRSYYAVTTIRNTIILSLYNLAVGFPLPIILAILIHYLPFRGYQRVLQTVFYAPNFISVVVVASMAFIMLSPSTGLVNNLIRAIGGEPIFFLAESGWFRHIFVVTVIWQHTGVGAIIYLGVLTTIDPALHESAMIDGAGKLKRILHIDLPSLMPTAIVLLILAFGRVMSIGFDRAFLLQTPLNLATSEILPTYIYKVGVLGSGAIPRYSFATAVGLTNSVINLCLVVLMNQVAKYSTNTRLF